MKTYQAVGDILLMRPTIKLDVDEGTGLRQSGGILIPENAKVGPEGSSSPIMEFRVVSCGPDCKVVKEGNVVLANGQIAMKIPLPDGGSFAMIAEHQIIAVVTEKSDDVAQKA